MTEMCCDISPFPSLVHMVAFPWNLSMFSPPYHAIQMELFPFFFMFVASFALLVQGSNERQDSVYSRDLLPGAANTLGELGFSSVSARRDLPDAAPNGRLQPHLTRRVVSDDCEISNPDPDNIQTCDPDRCGRSRLVYCNKPYVYPSRDLLSYINEIC